MILPRHMISEMAEFVGAKADAKLQNGGLQSEWKSTSAARRTDTDSVGFTSYNMLRP